jgi:hypothetical protein
MGKKFLAGSALAVETAVPVEPREIEIDVSLVPFIMDFQEERKAKMLLEFFRGAKKPGQLPSLPKCDHGVYDPHGDQKYCSVCDPTVVMPSATMFSDAISKAIKNGLAHARRILFDYKEEGRRNYKDLRQIVDIEVWKATLKYGRRMNQKLAFVIAQNQANKFLAILANEPRKISLVAESIAAPETGSSLSVASGFYPDWNSVPGVPELVKTWHGVKRKVADHLLQDSKVSVREIPGVPKSTVSRVRKIVLEEFKKVAA